MYFSVACATALLLLLSPSPVSAQFTYWVDDATCRNTPARTAAFNAALAGALDLANRGYQRLQSATDTDMKDNFNKLFKTDYNTNANAQNTVDGVLGAQAYQGGQGIARWAVAPTRLQSNVRIYCDNDAQNPAGGSRWTLVPDVAPALQWQGYVLNANRPRAFQPGAALPGAPGAPFYQEWEDVQNGVYTLSRGCQTPNPNGGAPTVQAETYTVDTMPPPAGQPALRSVVTLCDLQLNSNLHSFGDIPLKKDLAALVKPPALPTGIDAFLSMTAEVLLHEFTHTRPLLKQDVVGANGRAYSWTDCIGLNAADSLNNVNNFVFLALLGKLADRHWRLSKMYNDWHNRGALVYDLQGITNKLRRGRRWRAWTA